MFCVCVCMFNCVQLSDPMDCSLPGSSLRFPRQEYWSGLLFPSPGDLPNSGIEPMSPVSPALAGRFFTTVPLGKPLCSTYDLKRQAELSVPLPHGTQYRMVG